MLSLVSMLVRTLLAQPAQPDDADNSVRRIIYAFAITDEEKDVFERRFDVRLTSVVAHFLEFAVNCPLYDTKSARMERTFH